jgi:hypothetical protein
MAWDVHRRPAVKSLAGRLVFALFGFLVLELLESPAAAAGPMRALKVKLNNLVTKTLKDGEARGLAEKARSKSASLHGRTEAVGELHRGFEDTSSAEWLKQRWVASSIARNELGPDLRAALKSPARREEVIRAAFPLRGTSLVMRKDPKMRRALRRTRRTLVKEARQEREVARDAAELEAAFGKLEQAREISKSWWDGDHGDAAKFRDRALGMAQDAAKRRDEDEIWQLANIAVDAQKIIDPREQAKAKVQLQIAELVKEARGSGL